MPQLLFLRTAWLPALATLAVPRFMCIITEALKTLCANAMTERHNQIKMHEEPDEMAGRTNNKSVATLAAAERARFCISQGALWRCQNHRKHRNCSLDVSRTRGTPR